MSVYRTPKSPYWQYDFQTQGRRFHGSTGAETRRAAEQFERRLRAEIAAGGGPAPKCLTINEAAERYFQEAMKGRPSADGGESRLLGIITGLKPETRLDQIDDEKVADYVGRRRAALSNASMNRELDDLRALLRRAKRIWKQPVQDIEWPAHRPPMPKGRVRELRDDEEAALFAALEERAPDLLKALAFMAISGLRFANVRTLTWSMVDFGAGVITVLVKDRTKHHGRRHALPITPAIRAALMAQKSEHPIYVFSYAAKRPRPGQRVKGERYPFTRSGWRKQWAAACTDAKIEDFRPHDLRHTFATRLLRATGNLKLAQKALGHADIRSTGRYAHVQVDDLRQGLEAVEQSRNSPGRLKAVSDK